MHTRTPGQDLPRPNMRYAQALVRAFCTQHGLPYSETGLLASYAQVGAYW